MSAESIRTFAVPDLGEGLEEVTVTSWDVAVGDEIELNQTLCTVETAKAEVEIPSPYAGRVVELGGAECDVLQVGAPLVRIDTGPAVSPPGSCGGSSFASPSSSLAEPAGSCGGSSFASPSSSLAEPPGSATDGRTPVLVGYGADDTFDTSRRIGTSRTGRPKAKPGARKLAAELGVDLAGVPPGPSGVITADGVRAAAGGAPPGEDLRPLSPVQAAMAERMTLSRSRIPDAHASVQVDGANLLRLRDRLAAHADGAAITPFVLILRLLVVALARHPVLNATWVDTPDGPRIRTHHAVHLGFGVAASRGLLVPVVFDAQRKTTRELTDSVARLIAGARAGTLTPDELRGSTFTVSNFGALGLDDGVPVINYPEAAILGIGSLRPRPVAVGDTVVVRPQLTLTCAFDHRVADGAQVAEFLCGLRDLIENPDIALLDL